MNIYDIWFARIEIANSIKLKLLKQFISETIWNLKKQELIELNIEESAIKKILDIKYKKNLEKYETYMIKNNIFLFSYKDKLYPEKLKYIVNKPAYIFIRGNLEILNEDNVAIVGARKCSNYGKKIAFDTAKELSNLNINVVSGLAIGIDTYAHLGSFEGKYGKTIAVLGNGLDIRDIYPTENIKLAEKILNTGGILLSEYIIGTKSTKYNFPQRNRIISAISDKILVVEATQKSGTLITVRICT